MGDNKERQKEYQEVTVGWECSVTGCKWKINGKIPFFRALPQFGQHNLKEHDGTRYAHMVEVLAHPARTDFPSRRRQY